MQHRRARARAVAVAMAVLAGFGGVLAACGGGGEPERVSRAAMVREADRVCAAGLREADRLRAGADAGAQGESAADEIDASLGVLTRQIDAFAELRGPAATDAAREDAVRNLRAAADGLEELRKAAIDDDLTIDGAIRANPKVVQRVNAASAKASDALAELGFLTCIGLAGE